MAGWLTYSPTSGHCNGTISITADTLTELQDRISTVVAHTNYDGVSASTEILQTYKNATGISITNLTWVDNIPWYGGVATKRNCSYSVIAYYEDGTSDDITSLAVVTGETIVDSTTSSTVTTAGTLTLTATYNQLIATASTTFQSTGTTTIYQDEYGHTDNKSEYLTFSILENGSIKYQYNINPSQPIVGRVAKQIYYSINGGEWISSSQNVHYTIINVSAGDTIRFKGENEVYWDNDSFFQDAIASLFTQTPLCNIYGNILSMNYGDNFRLYTELPTPSNPDYDWGHFHGFFNGTNVLSAAGLWLPTPHTQSYMGMFGSCSHLSATPKLPTTLALGCYALMFAHCTSLITAPELPATTLNQDCYSAMFYGCTSLNYIKCLATDISASNCTTDWVDGVAATGTFVKNPNMSGWATGDNGIPTGWTVQDAT